jgi:deoxyadenosine/deoxycytidine kinase
MSKLIAVVGVSGIGKTTLVRALAKAYPPVLSSVEGFQTAYEGHADRPFQALFKQDARYALANQIDYFLLCAEQEKQLRASPQIGLTDGGLDLDFHGFTRLFHQRGLLTDAEFDLCRRAYRFLRESLPPPELFVHLWADEGTVAARLSTRDRINIARAEDTAIFNALVQEWLATIPPGQVLKIDVSNETSEYAHSIRRILNAVRLDAMNRR